MQSEVERPVWLGSVCKLTVVLQHIKSALNDRRTESKMCLFCSKLEVKAVFFHKHQPAVDNDWSVTRNGVCDWLKGLPVRLHLLHQLQQRNNAFWDVVVGPGAEPVVSDRTALRVQLEDSSRWQELEFH